MLCQKCHKESATFHYRETINGESQSWHLCPSCAKEQESFFLERRKAAICSLHHFFPEASSKPPVCVKEMPKKSPLQTKEKPSKVPLEEMSSDELQAHMKTCIREEDYEKAAKIRDILKARA